MPGRLQYYDDEVVFERKYVDAFDRLRVGAPYTLADHVHGRKLRQGDTLTFLGQGEAGANSAIRGSVTWREVR